VKTFQLYSTPGCHLCELAKEVIWPLLDEFDLRMEEVDIADSDELVERYGVRIPVLHASGIGRELDWPFDQVQAREFLATLNY
jgi:hypothetical protein